ncbi:WD40 repeat domain-containing protein [Dactylosporangium sp. NPDC005555]|uniref:WD40 repeat domain-containing protein n=1 Tax=Dactylosporangium sp. NPDC005555 TaxID=3154889 RepID=UPI0033BEB79F
MIAHRGPISGIAAFGDTYVLTAGYDNQIILWDMPSKTPIARAWHDHLANQVAFSPDGRLAVTSSSDYGARLWALPDLRLIAVLADHTDDVEMSAFHPTRELIATASRDHDVRVYDFHGGLVARFQGHTADVISVEWSADADELVSSSDDGTIKRWSLRSQRLVTNLDMDGVETDTIAISSAGTIYAGNDEGQIIVVTDGGRTTLDAHDAGVKRVVLDDGRALLVTLSYDRTMKLWNVADREPVLVATADLPADVWPRSCAFAGDAHLVFATFGATYRTYDHRTGEWLAEAVPPTGGVNAVLAGAASGVVTVGDAGIVRRDGSAIAETGSLCNFLVAVGDRVYTGGQLGKLFDAGTGAQVHQHRSPLNCGVQFVHDGRRHVLIGTYTGEGLLFEQTGDGLRHVSDLRLHANAVKGVAESGGYLFSVCADTSATWFRADDLQPVATIEDAHHKIANGCAGLGDGYFASVSRDLLLRIWDPQQRPTVIETPHDHSIKCVSASADGRYVGTGGYHGRVCVYDRDSGSWVVDDRPTTAGISSMSYAPALGRFLAGSYDGNVYQVGI